MAASSRALLAAKPLAVPPKAVHASMNGPTARARRGAAIFASTFPSARRYGAPSALASATAMAVSAAASSQRGSVGMATVGFAGELGW